MAKLATSVRCVTQSEGTVPRVGLWGIAGTPPCSRMLQVDSRVKLQRFSASTWSFLDFAYSQVGDLISINLFWGKNLQHDGGVGEWEQLGIWEVAEQHRDHSGDSYRPEPLVSNRLYLLTLAPRHLGTLTWIPLSHISLPVTDTAFLNDETIFPNTTII